MRQPGTISPSTVFSLAAGVLPEFPPVEVVHAAADAGFGAVGIWFDPETWSDAVASTVRTALEARELIALDMEPVFVTPEGDHGDRLIDAASTVGAKNVLVVCRGVAEGPFTERFAALCDRAAPADIDVCVEFGRLFGTANLAAALRVVTASGQANAGVLVDNLHLARTGDTAADLLAVPAGALPYAQLCDAGPAVGDTYDDLRAEALHGRMNLGDGVLPVLDVWQALPTGTPISLEVRSAELRQQHPEATPRATSVLNAATAALQLAIRAPS